MLHPAIFLVALLAAAPPRVIVEPATGIELVELPAGTFWMGSPEDEPSREIQESRHQVTLTRPFQIGRYEVTERQWEVVMGTRPAQAPGCSPRCPVVEVSFPDVEEFLARLNRKAGGGFRLPTEAEWEYAARAGTTTTFATGDTLTPAQAHVRFGAAAVPGRPLPVGLLPANAWGLHDMHGNVWEWCADWHCPYPEGAVTDPRGECASGLRVLRGGSYLFGPDSARSALRYTHRPQDRGPSLGFRVARDVPPR